MLLKKQLGYYSRPISSSNYFVTVGIKSRKLKISKWKIKVYLLPAYKNILHIKQPKSKKKKKKKRKKEKKKEKKVRKGKDTLLKTNM